MLKDEHDCYYTAGGDARPLRRWSDFSSLYYRIIKNTETNDPKNRNSQILNAF